MKETGLEKIKYGSPICVPVLHFCEQTDCRVILQKVKAVSEVIENGKYVNEFSFSWLVLLLLIGSASEFGMNELSQR